MLGVRAYGIGQRGQEDELAQLSSLESRVLGIRATVMVLPPAYRTRILERAERFLGEIQSLRSIAESGTPNVAQQSELFTRLNSLPAEIDLLEQALQDGAEEAARAGVEPAAPGAVPRPPAGPGLGGLGMVAALAAMVGAGIWAAS